MKIIKIDARCLRKKCQEPPEEMPGASRRIARSLRENCQDPPKKMPGAPKKNARCFVSVVFCFEKSKINFSKTVMRKSTFRPKDVPIETIPVRQWWDHPTYGVDSEATWAPWDPWAQGPGPLGPGPRARDHWTGPRARDQGTGTKGPGPGPGTNPQLPDFAYSGTRNKRILKNRRTVARF